MLERIYFLNIRCQCLCFVIFMTENYIAPLRVIGYMCHIGSVHKMIKILCNKKALREHKPPPIRRIRISDFGLPDPKRDPDRHHNCITWSLSHALLFQKISSKSVHKFASNLTDRQTNRPNQKHNLLLRRR